MWYGLLDFEVLSTVLCLLMRVRLLGLEPFVAEIEQFCVSLCCQAPCYFSGEACWVVPCVGMLCVAFCFAFV